MLPHQQLGVGNGEELAQLRAVLSRQRVYFDVQRFGAVPLVMYPSVIVFAEEVALCHGLDRLLLQIDQGQFLACGRQLALGDAVREGLITADDMLCVFGSRHLVVGKLACI